MSDAFFYPELDLKTLKNLEVVRQLAVEHPSYWLTSPYSGEVEKLCSTWFAPKRAVQAGTSDDADEEDDEEGSGWEFLHKESVQLYKDLRHHKHDALNDGDASSYFRTATTLLEKLLTMQERAQGLKQVSEYHALVLDIMESILSPTQRTEVMERLEAATKGAK